MISSSAEYWLLKLLNNTDRVAGSNKAMLWLRSLEIKCNRRWQLKRLTFKRQFIIFITIFSLWGQKLKASIKLLWVTRQGIGKHTIVSIISTLTLVSSCYRAKVICHIFSAYHAMVWTSCHATFFNNNTEGSMYLIILLCRQKPYSYIVVQVKCCEVHQTFWNGVPKLICGGWWIVTPI